MTGCAWRLTRGPPRDLYPSGEGEECDERGARAGRRKMPEAQERSRRDAFRVVRFAVLRAERESELTEQLESCAGSQTSKAQEKRRLSNRQLEEVKVECQEPLNAMAVQDSAVPKQKHLEDRMGSETRIRATSVESNAPISSLGRPLARIK